MEGKMKNIFNIKIIRVYILLLTYFSFYSTNVVADSNCLSHLGQYEINYTGSISGPGLMQIFANPQHNDQYVFRTVLFSPEQDDQKNPVVTLEGIGSCDNGVFKVRFGANAGENDKYKILGGSTVAVMQPEVTEQQFGYWEVVVLDKETSDHQEMRGVWLVQKKLDQNNN